MLSSLWTKHSRRTGAPAELSGRGRVAVPLYLLPVAVGDTEQSTSRVKIEANSREETATFEKTVRFNGPFISQADANPTGKTLSDVEMILQ